MLGLGHCFMLFCPFVFFVWQCRCFNHKWLRLFYTFLSQHWPSRNIPENSNLLTPTKQKNVQAIKIIVLLLTFDWILKMVLEESLNHSQFECLLYIISEFYMNESHLHLHLHRISLIKQKIVQAIILLLACGWLLKSFKKVSTVHS